MKYQHLFFDLDHTIWDFEANSKATLQKLFTTHSLSDTLTPDFEGFYQCYSAHNKRLWDRYHHGFIKQEELRWKRMWHTMLDFKNGDEKLAKQLSQEYLELLPLEQALFPYTMQILNYLAEKGYRLHLITNGFEEVQNAKLRNSRIDSFFDHIITSEKAMALKPQKAIFDYALNIAGANLSQSIMLGDNLDADIKGAMDAGMDTVFVNHIEESTMLAPTYMVTHLQQLENIF